MNKEQVILQTLAAAQSMIVALQQNDATNDYNFNSLDEWMDFCKKFVLLDSGERAPYYNELNQLRLMVFNEISKINMKMVSNNTGAINAVNNFIAAFTRYAVTIHGLHNQIYNINLNPNIFGD